MTRSISRDIVCATLACALALPVAAAELPKLSAGGPYPKICLVLSGGGARGAAHVGVIKVLEELRVPIHCITGTIILVYKNAGYFCEYGTGIILSHIQI